MLPQLYLSPKLWQAAAAARGLTLNRAMSHIIIRMQNIRTSPYRWLANGPTQERHQSQSWVHARVAGETQGRLTRWPDRTRMNWTPYICWTEVYDSFFGFLFVQYTEFSVGCRFIFSKNTIFQTIRTFSAYNVIFSYHCARWRLKRLYDSHYILRNIFTNFLLFSLKSTSKVQPYWFSDALRS